MASEGRVVNAASQARADQAASELNFHVEVGVQAEAEERVEPQFVELERLEGLV
jgi:hypothetical protein